MSFCILCESESAKLCWDGGGVTGGVAEAPSSVEFERSTWFFNFDLGKRKDNNVNEN